MVPSSAFCFWGAATRWGPLFPWGPPYTWGPLFSWGPPYTWGPYLHERGLHMGSGASFLPLESLQCALVGPLIAWGPLWGPPERAI